MAAPPNALFGPPEGWLPGAFGYNFALEWRSHPSALAWAAVFFVLLVVGRTLLSAHDRRRLRFGFFFFVLYFLTIPLRALLLTFGGIAHYGLITGAALVFLIWGMISVIGLYTFDLVGQRVGLPKIVRDLVVTIASLAALVMIVSRSGVNLLSIITTSAVVTAVIGLALQDTLGNLLSGIALQIEAPFAIGDWIKVDEKGQEGRVREIRWRSTMIETRNGDLVVIPNAMVTKGVLNVFSKDGLENRRWIYFNVHARHPPNVVEQVVLAALEGTPNVSTRTPPDCLLLAFEDSWIRYSIRYRIVEYRLGDPTDSAIRKRIWYALHRAGLEMPYPAFNIFTTELTQAREQDKSERELGDRLRALALISIFAPLHAEERKHLARGLRRELYARGERIIRAGDPGDSLYLIHTGEVEVKIAANGVEKKIAVLKSGEFFGEMGLLTGEARRASVVAKSDAECYVIDRDLFHEVLQKKESLVGEIGRLLHERDVALQMNWHGISAEVARSRSQEALLARIRNFFGLT